MSGVVLIMHDGTELDYTGLKSLKDDSGQLGNGKQHGYICHNSLAVVEGSGEVIGLADQILHRRREVPKDESRVRRREREDRESRLWSTASASIGATPEGCRWVDVADRGGDMFEFLADELKMGRDW